jgi:gamma-glutamylcyclotransferase (GGCT)/AIG2-like uncharacterized protein YtfP
MSSLFIYGSLHPDRAPAAIAATAKRLRHFGSATVQGRVYDLGEYPGLILSEDSSECVRGEVFLLPEGPEGLEMLARLDAYEDYRPQDPKNSLFLRQMTMATVDDGRRRPCWVYTYHRAVCSSDAASVVGKK